MKAAINEKGKLTLTPETPLESFALKMWWDNYSLELPSDGAGRFAVLEIVINEVV